MRKRFVQIEGKLLSGNHISGASFGRREEISTDITDQMTTLFFTRPMRANTLAEIQRHRAHKTVEITDPAEKPSFPILCELTAHRLQGRIDSVRLHTRVERRTHAHTHRQTGPF